MKQGETLLKITEEQWEESLTMNREDFRFASTEGWTLNGLFVRTKKIPVILITSESNFS